MTTAGASGDIMNMGVSKHESKLATLPIQQLVIACELWIIFYVAIKLETKGIIYNLTDHADQDSLN